jgi:hypothetical protein
MFFSALECFVKCIFVFLNLLAARQQVTCFVDVSNINILMSIYGLNQPVSIEILIGLASTLNQTPLTDNHGGYNSR